MARRRGRNEGTISLRADGRWMARVSLERGPDGRRRRKVAYGSTRKEAANALARLLGRKSSGELLSTGTPTVRAWLDHWYATHVDEWRPQTKRVYRSAIDQWLAPVFGPTRLDALRPAAVQQWLNDAGARVMVRTAHCVLRSAIKFAQVQRVVAINAAELVKVPRPVARRATPLSAEQAATLIGVIDQHRLGAMVAVSLLTGLRIGEASGLRWADLDLDGATMDVRRQVLELPGGLVEAELKTTNSRRRLALPLALVKALRAHRAQQREERLRAGAAWQQGSDYVFTTPTGAPLRPAVARAALRALLGAAGLPAVRWHALRHSLATLLLESGAPLFVVSRTLGHGEIATTSNTYGHVTTEMREGAALRMDDVLARGRRGVS